MKAYKQRMGRSLMLPVAVLPAASLLVGIANWIVGMGVSNAGTTFLMNAGLAIKSLGIIICRRTSFRNV